MTDNNANKIKGMGTEKDIIVAVELGSAAIRAIAGRRELDGNMHVLAVVRKADEYAIRRGVVDNINRTAQTLQEVTRQLGERLDMQVAQVYVGLGGQSLHTVLNTIEYPMDQKTIITDEIIQRIDDMNRAQQYSGMDILQAEPQEYRIDSRGGVITPVGMEAKNIKAPFLNVLADVRLRSNIESSVENAGLRLAEDDILISPLALGRYLLTDQERKSGCALVDIGAATTTVIIYSRNTLRHLVVIPLGGDNATADIVRYGAQAEDAEALKRKYGTAYCQEPREGEGSDDEMVNLSYDRSVSKHKLKEIVEARYQEIIANVWEHVRPYCDNQFSNIIFTGAGSRVPGLADAFVKYTKTSKLVRVHHGLPAGIVLAPGCNPTEADCLDTLYSLLLSGKETCVVEKPQVVHQDVLFPDEEETEEPAASSVASQQPEPSATPQAAAGEEPAVEPEPKKKRGGLGSKLRRAFNVFKGMLEEEEDDTANA